MTYINEDGNWKEIPKTILYEIGKSYFRAMLAKPQNNVVYGNQLTFGLNFRDENGEIHTQIIETINKKDL